MNTQTHSARYFIALITAILFWGVAWSVGKIAVEHANPQVAAFYRYAISLIALLPVIFYLKVSFKTDLKGVFYMVLAGGLTALFNYLFFAGVSHGQAGYGGTLVTSLAPIMTYLLSIIVFKISITTKQIVALSLGIIGAIVLLRIPFEGLGFLHVESLYFFYCAVVWSFVTIFSQKVAKSTDPLFYTLVVFSITTLINLYFALPYHPLSLEKYDSVFWISILFIGIVPGTFSTMLYFISASKVGAHNTAIFMFVVPVGAIVSSYIIFGESVEYSTIVGCLLAFIAVYIFNKKGNLKRS